MKFKNSIIALGFYSILAGCGTQDVSHRGQVVSKHVVEQKESPCISSLDSFVSFPETGILQVDRGRRGEESLIYGVDPHCSGGTEEEVFVRVWNRPVGSRSTHIKNEWPLDDGIDSVYYEVDRQPLVFLLREGGAWAGGVQSQNVTTPAETVAIVRRYEEQMNDLRQSTCVAQLVSTHPRPRHFSYLRDQLSTVPSADQFTPLGVVLESHGISNSYSFMQEEESGRFTMYDNDAHPLLKIMKNDELLELRGNHTSLVLYASGDTCFDGSVYTREQGIELLRMAESIFDRLAEWYNQ